jgi:hypothetical protein
MKIDAIRGSEGNPEGTEEHFSGLEIPELDDISGANDPLGVPDVETPDHLEGIVHDGGVIDPVE